jgi:hypothetical protein
MRRLHHDAAAAAPDPRLDAGLRRLALLGTLLVLLLPGARGSSAWLGALPLWLLCMPLASWWALHRFPLPAWPPRVQARRRSGRVQARRRTPVARRARGLRAAA